MNQGLKPIHIILLVVALFLMWLPKEAYVEVAKPLMSEEQKMGHELNSFAKSLGDVCVVASVCENMMQINCRPEVDGPIYYYTIDPREKISTCGGECMNGACDLSQCPPQQWTCDGKDNHEHLKRLERVKQMRGDEATVDNEGATADEESALPEPSAELTGKPIYDVGGEPVEEIDIEVKSPAKEE